MSLLVRQMTMDDVEQVIAIDQASFSLPWPPRSFRFELTENPAARCWVAEQDSRVAGMLVGWLIVDEIHIATIATHPDFRHQGIGKTLLSFALQAARQEGATSSFLEVRASNFNAIEMYKRFGFIEYGRRLGYYKDNHEDAILMSLSLISARQHESS